MKLLILTQYYPPEVGAPQNRLHELAVRLKSAGIEVEVLTALPNYPKMEVMEEYLNGKKREEVIEGIPVHRSWIYVSHSKGIISRLLNYFSFVWSSYRRGKKLKGFDYILVESPPLFLGYSAMRLSRKLSAGMIFNVSDLWPESAEKMGIVTNSMLLRMAYRLEEKCYKRAVLVTGQTMGIVENINDRFPDVNTHWLPNGVDPNFYDPNRITASGFRNQNGIPEENIVFFYGGILGHAQGLQLILQVASRVKDLSNVTFILQGAGPEKEMLLELKKSLAVENVLFLPPVDKSKMPGILKEVDVALVPLRKLDLFKGAIPSKIFEALAMEKVLLLGVEGEAKTHFIDNAKAGMFFEPENEADLEKCIREMSADKVQLKEMGRNGRKYVIEHFNRDQIAKDLLIKLDAIKK